MDYSKLVLARNDPAPFFSFFSARGRGRGPNPNLEGNVGVTALLLELLLLELLLLEELLLLVVLLLLLLLGVLLLRHPLVLPARRAVPWVFDRRARQAEALGVEPLTMRAA